MRLPKFLRRRPPQLVIPAVEIRADPTLLAIEEWDPQFALGAPEWNDKRMTIHLPKDPLYYQGLKPLRRGEPRHEVSYDPEAATTQLLRAAFCTKLPQG